jgi:hypothetical protein
MPHGAAKREKQMETNRSRNYAEAQYSTPAAMQMIRDRFLPLNPTEADIESAARYMSKSLFIGGIKTCRALVIGAVKAAA